jgi:hypothetical protein
MESAPSRTCGGNDLGSAAGDAAFSELRAQLVAKLGIPEQQAKSYE